MKRGATWMRKNSEKCLVNDYKKCFKNGLQTWENVSLNEFLECKDNPAFNRQTKMLALYNTDFNLCTLKNINQNIILLENAKNTLKSFLFFALNEYQMYSKFLFEKSFGNGLFKFDKEFRQSNVSIAEKYINYINESTINRIKELNYLDMKLYEYAKSLFFERLNTYNLI